MAGAADIDMTLSAERRYGTVVVALILCCMPLLNTNWDTPMNTLYLHFSDRPKVKYGGTHFAGVEKSFEKLYVWEFVVPFSSKEVSRGTN